jgi:RNA polymerase-binding transcription factor DksA
MDDIDLASKLIEKTIQKALNDNKKKLEPSSVTCCNDCGIDLGARKLAMPSAKKCIDCQEIEDIKNG